MLHIPYSEILYKNRSDSKVTIFMKYHKISENIPSIVILVLFIVILGASLWMVILYSKSPSSNSQNIISHSFNKSSNDTLIFR